MKKNAGKASKGAVIGPAGAENFKNLARQVRACTSASAMRELVSANAEAFVKARARVAGGLKRMGRAIERAHEGEE